MRISEMLQLPQFEDSRLLTGEIGLNNEVDSVMVLEAVDIEKWSRKNQLILTSFFAFDNLPYNEIESFFDKMEKIGISGLVVKVERLLNMIPQWIVDLCHKHHIPLIKISSELTYEQIMLSIYQPILNHQSHVLKTYYEVRQRLAPLTRNFASLEQIMTEFQRIIRKDCLLKIPEQNITISKGSTSPELVVTSREPLASVEFTKNHYYQVKLLSYQGAKEYHGTEVNILNNFGDECTLLVYHGTDGLRETEMMVLENVVDVIQEKLQIDYLIRRDRYTRMNNLADAILQNTPRNIDELDSLLQEADMANYDLYQGVTFSTRAVDSQLIKREVRNALRTLKTHTLFFEHHDYLIVLYNFRDTDKAITKERVKAMFDAEIHELPDLMFSVSQVKRKSQLKEILLECLETLRFNREYFIDHVVATGDLGIFRYFLQDGDLETVRQLIPENLIQLQLASPELFTTLYTFFRKNRNYKETSEELFLHVKTIRYRLNRVQELLDLDFENSIQTLNLELGTYLLEMKRRRDHAKN